jgi:large repetitive protein
VDLTMNASGGPFTGATIVSLSPSPAGTASIVAEDVAGSRRYLLNFTPAATFAGNASLRYTLSAGTQTSPEAIITFNVAPRPDPSQDAEVRGQSNAQVDTARRFANAQGRNFGQRLERLHDRGERRRLEGGLGLSAMPSCTAGADGAHGCDGAQGGGLFVGPGRSAKGEDTDASIWVAGTVSSGEQDGRDGRVARFDFQTDGISLGADLRISDAFAWGGGIGYGRDTSRIGDDGTRNRASARALAMYASYRPGQHVFVDGLVGWQQLDYDLRRRVTATGGIVEGHRDGDQWFSALTAGADLDRGAWRFVPYARLDLARTTLEAYRETGDPIFALAYEPLDAESVVGNLGLRVDYRMQTSWGAFEPQLRLEYQHDFHGTGDAVVRYADLTAGPLYRVRIDESRSHRFNLGLGAALRFDRGWLLRFEYRGEAGDDNRIEQAVQIGADWAF